MSTFGWVALAIGIFVLGQFLMLRPNPMEQQRMQLREAARKAGFQVYLRVIPDWLPEPDGRRLVAHYIYLDEGLRLFSGRYWHNRGGDWLAEGIFREKSLNGPGWDRWSSRLLGLESTANALTLYWLEDASVDEVPDLRRLVADISSEISFKS